MAVERWTDEMLDRTAEIAASNPRTAQALADAIAEGAQKHERTAEIAASNARTAQALADAIAEGIEERQQMYQIILQQQAEIRGIQTENQRILAILL
jgi:uncharacterized protein YaaN involved in tellurite resistance